jgi:hydroxymethylpyrimidine pyrophosphatase-like HAD family hydrolase
MRTAFASDFDGTLYFRTRTPDILPADIEAILAYQAAGNLFGF